MPITVVDVRAQMPNYENYKDWTRPGGIVGIAMHHSATAHRDTGAPIGDAASFFNYHVNTLGWSHGGYNYVITANGTIEYALDEKISAYHAGFKDPMNSMGLEQGQYWNNHYLAICVAGWFDSNRTYQDDSGVHTIPNQHITPNQAQWTALYELIDHLRQKYHLPLENIRGHRELLGNATGCPGLNVDPAQVRRYLYQTYGEITPITDSAPQGEHVLVLPDMGDYLTSALGYIWRFQPDVTAQPPTVGGKWTHITAVGNIDPDLLADYRQQGAELVQHIPGSAAEVRAVLDKLATANQPFLPHKSTAGKPTYTVQPGDTLSKIAQVTLGNPQAWLRIFEANRDQLDSANAPLTTGMRLTIPGNQE